jgi:nitrite reductase/ring-hydroxylating ferredoxin subunit
MDLSRRTFVIATTAAVASCACGAALCDAADAKDAAPTTVDVGTLADYPKDGVINDSFAKVHKVLVVRAEGKIYAPSARCTHKGTTVKAKDGQIACPAHSSKFDLKGAPKSGPAKKALARFGISVNAEGHIIVDKTKQFEQAKWNEPGASISAIA